MAICKGTDLEARHGSSIPRLEKVLFIDQDQGMEPEVSCKDMAFCWWCKTILTFLGSMEADIELLHAVIDQRDLIVGHETVGVKIGATKPEKR